MTWVRKSLGEICRVVSGATPRSEVPEYWGGDTVWVTPTDLGRLQERVVSDSARRITRAGYESCSAEEVPPGSVVLSSRAPIGHLAIAGVRLCTNQGCKSFVPSADVDSEFLYLALRHEVPRLRALGSGATFAEVSKTQVEAFELSMPQDTGEQKALAARLLDTLAAVERARMAAAARLEATGALPRAALVQFGRDVQGATELPIAEVATFGPAVSVANEGDVVVPYVTSGCLTELGFRADGVRPARMRARDVDQARIAVGEVLVARSNTPELVGRACVFDGSVAGAAAGDLTIRLRVGPEVLPEFLSSWLSHLFVSGFWRDRAGGASGTMKKITRAQLAEVRVPVPDKAEQKAIVAALSDTLGAARRLMEGGEAELAAIEALPPALLRRAFNGHD